MPTEDFYYQDQLIKNMVAIGFSEQSKAGCCFGFSQMAINAHLKGTFDDYLKMIKFIKNLSVSQVSMLRDFVQQTTVISKDEQAKPKVNYGTQLEIGEASYSIAEILAFMEGVSLYQLPGEHTKFLQSQDPASQHAHTQLALGADKLYQPAADAPEEASQKRVTPVAQWTRGLTKLELEQTIRSLQANMEVDFSVNIISANHSISVHYNAKDKQWLVLDPNKLPGQKFDLSQTSDMASAILEAQASPIDRADSSSVYGLHFSFFSTSENANVFQAGFEDFNNEEDIQKINDITLQKLFQKVRGSGFGVGAGNSDLTLAGAAIRFGQDIAFIDQMLESLKYNTDFNNSVVSTTLAYGHDVLAIKLLDKGYPIPLYESMVIPDGFGSGKPKIEYPHYARFRKLVIRGGYALIEPVIRSAAKMYGHTTQGEFDYLLNYAFNQGDEPFVKALITSSLCNPNLTIGNDKLIQALEKRGWQSAANYLKEKQLEQENKFIKTVFNDKATDAEIIDAIKEVAEKKVAISEKNLTGALFRISHVLSDDVFKVFINQFDVSAMPDFEAALTAAIKLNREPEIIDKLIDMAPKLDVGCFNFKDCYVPSDVKEETLSRIFQKYDNKISKETYIDIYKNSKHLSIDILPEHLKKDEAFLRELNKVRPDLPKSVGEVEYYQLLIEAIKDNDEELVNEMISSSIFSFNISFGGVALQQEFEKRGWQTAVNSLKDKQSELELEFIKTVFNDKATDAEVIEAINMAIEKGVPISEENLTGALLKISHDLSDEVFRAFIKNFDVFKLFVNELGFFDQPKFETVLTAAIMLNRDPEIIDKLIELTSELEVGCFNFKSFYFRSEVKEETLSRIFQKHDNKISKETYIEIYKNNKHLSIDILPEHLKQDDGFMKELKGVQAIATVQAPTTKDLKNNLGTLLANFKVTINPKTLKIVNEGGSEPQKFIRIDMSKMSDDEKSHFMHGMKKGLYAAIGKENTKGNVFVQDEQLAIDISVVNKLYALPPEKQQAFSDTVNIHRKQQRIEQNIRAVKQHLKALMIAHPEMSEHHKMELTRLVDDFSEKIKTHSGTSEILKISATKELVKPFTKLADEVKSEFGNKHQATHDSMKATLQEATVNERAENQELTQEAQQDTVLRVR